LKSLAEGALEALQHLKPEDEVAVMAYAASARVLQEATTDGRWQWPQSKRRAAWKVEKLHFHEGIFRRRSN